MKYIIIDEVCNIKIEDINDSILEGFLEWCRREGIYTFKIEEVEKAIQKLNKIKREAYINMNQIFENWGDSILKLEEEVAT